MLGYATQVVPAMLPTSLCATHLQGRLHCCSRHLLMPLLLLLLLLLVLELVLVLLGGQVQQPRHSPAGCRRRRGR